MDESTRAGGGRDAPPSGRKVRGYAEVAKETRSGLLEQVLEHRSRLAARLVGVGCIVGVVSGKGGVGKSAVTANLAVTLARRGARVGVVDADLNGPCLGRMLGLLGSKLEDGPDGVHPATGPSGVVGISTELLLDESVPLRWRGPESDSFIWQGTTEVAVLREFLSDVVWGELDYLLVDVPPGTDKISRFLDLVAEPHQVLLVTIPSSVSVSVVSRAATLLRRAGVETVRIVGNMTGYSPPGAEASLPLFSRFGVAELAESSGLEIWAEVPFDPEFGALTDGGDSPGSKHPGAVGSAFGALAEKVEGGPGGRNRTE
jgi:ATP-binding protein involved in chromosome partitioning